MSSSSLHCRLRLGNVEACFLPKSREFQIERNCYDNCFKLKKLISFILIFITAHIFLISLASGDCEGQSILVMPFSYFHTLHVRMYGIIAFLEYSWASIGAKPSPSRLQQILLINLYHSLCIEITRKQNSKTSLLPISFRQIVDTFFVSITFQSLRDELLKFSHVTSSRCIRQFWSFWVTTQKYCFQTIVLVHSFCLHPIVTQ